jgi:hypothetical protein
MTFKPHQCELLSEEGCAILSLILQFFAIRQLHIHKILFRITDLTDNHTAALCLSCAVITDCICTVECHLQFDTKIKQGQTPNAPQPHHSSTVLFR